jgi:hypothetical protein
MCRSTPICGSSMSEERVVLNRILLIGAIVGIALAHGVVLYKIDKGVRSADANQVMASGSPRAAYW